MMPIIEIEQLETRFGETVIHQHLDLAVNAGEILGLAGGSGSGKTTLLRAILMLLRPSAGQLRVFGQDVLHATQKQELSIRKRCGMMFQQGALFSSLTVLENICFPLVEFTSFSKKLIREIAILKASMAKFPVDALNKYPSELSGGMLKRAAIARAIVMDPELLFLDEPTAGLDPHSASALDELVLDLKRTLNLTIIIVTHDLDTLWRVTDRVAFLGEGRVLAVDPMKALGQHPDPLIYDYFHGPRARAAIASAEGDA